nr:hypothetical protein [Paenibacillus sp. JX-17]
MMRFISVLLGTAVLFGLEAPQAHAGYFDDWYKGIEQFSDLPNEVYKLKEDYQATLDELDQAKSNAQAYQEQNAQLVQQNEKLTAMVSDLRKAQEERDAYARRIKAMLFTVIGLIIGYFILTRLVRYGMRRRSHRGYRKE